jgi:hypothetical protein
MWRGLGRWQNSSYRARTRPSAARRQIVERCTLNSLATSTWDLPPFSISRASFCWAGESLDFASLAKGDMLRGMKPVVQ